MIRTLKPDPRAAGLVRGRIHDQLADREKLRSKKKWETLVDRHFRAIEYAAAAGMRQEVLTLLDYLAGECRSASTQGFEGSGSSFRPFHTMNGLLPEIGRLRSFYSSYYNFLDQQMAGRGFKCAEDVVVEPITDPTSVTERGTNLFLARQAVTSDVFHFGGTVVVGEDSAAYFQYPQLSRVKDQGQGRPKTIMFGDGSPFGRIIQWRRKDVSSVRIHLFRVPDIAVTRITSVGGTFDLFAVTKEEATINSGRIVVNPKGNPAGLVLSIDCQIPYGGVLGFGDLVQKQLAFSRALKSALENP